MSEREILYGRNSVVEAVRGGRKVHRIWLTKPTAGAIGKSLTEVWGAVEVVPKSVIAEITGRGDNQGAAAEVDPFEYAHPKSLLDLNSGVILTADGITDPRNLGATIRSAVLLGAKAILIPNKNSASVTPVVVHASSGATEHIPIARVDSLTHMLGLLGERGFAIAGAVLPGKGTVNVADYKAPDKLCIIVGDEGGGIRNKVLRKCGALLSIPQKSDFNSFNVSVAASIILYELQTGSGRFIAKLAMSN